MRKVIVLSGVSGAGKSEYAQKLAGASEHFWKIVSADHFFMRAGKYLFDPMKIGEAHGQCFRMYIEYVRYDGSRLIVVDNTNTTTEEIAPYMLGAQAFGCEAEVHVLTVNPKENLIRAQMRNVHGVSQAMIEAQYESFQRLSLPPWWSVKYVPAEFP